MKALNPLDAEDEHWAPMADLMAVLMLIFMLISTLYLRQLVEADEESALAEAARKEGYSARCTALYEELRAAVQPYKERWKVIVSEDLTVSFATPNVLFSSGSSTITSDFSELLDQFLPDLLTIVWDSGKDVQRVRIEGHTSSEFADAKTPNEAFVNNMELSQGRTRAILSYWLTLADESRDTRWIKENITANGLSSSRLKLDSEGNEDRARSRRVEFKLEASSCQKAGGIFQDEDQSSR